MGRDDNELSQSAGDNAKSGGWAQSGTLTGQNNDKQVSLQVNFPKSSNYTVEFTVSYPGTPVKRRKTEALITWTVNGNFVTRRVNVNNGVSVTGVGEAIRVVMKDANSGGGGDYVAGVSVAPGSRGGNKQPPTLLPAANSFVTIANAGTADIAIPADSGAISFFVAAVNTLPQAVTGGMLKAFQVDILGGVVLAVCDAQKADWIPIVPGADTIRLQNLSGADCQFFVMLGIDG